MWPPFETVARKGARPPQGDGHGSLRTTAIYDDVIDPDERAFAERMWLSGRPRARALAHRSLKSLILFRRPRMRTQKLPDPLDRLIGRNIRFFRIEGGFSQTDLAERIGVTFQQLQKYENAVNRIPASRLISIARALNVPVPILWTDHPDAAASETASRLPGVPQTRRRLTRAVSSISDPQLLKLIADLAEALAKASDS